MIFFVPFLVGLSHAAFALRALGTILTTAVLPYGAVTALAYLLFYGVAFTVIGGFYWRSLRAGLGPAHHTGQTA